MRIQSRLVQQCRAHRAQLRRTRDLAARGKVDDALTLARVEALSSEINRTLAELAMPETFGERQRLLNALRRAVSELGRCSHRLQFAAPGSRTAA